VSESQFEYGHFTLDELRSLAASPQVGTMQAMPASFRALADRVGEVADLLSHTQADLPNWWRGQAAEQAAATLGRAAAEARGFHGSALAAATAVNRCAQVVAEQQHQMMNVPDLPEPGVTAVVQRPATPFEALEAARQDAKYQAAHEQAVQVVNGIAAQYVETRSQLSNVGFEFDKGFTPADESKKLNSMGDSGKSDSLTAKPPAAGLPQPYERHRLPPRDTVNSLNTSFRGRTPLVALHGDHQASDSIPLEPSAGSEIQHGDSTLSLISTATSHEFPANTLGEKSEASRAVHDAPAAITGTALTRPTGDDAFVSSMQEIHAEGKNMRASEETRHRNRSPITTRTKSNHQTTDVANVSSSSATTETHFSPQTADDDVLPPRPMPQQTYQSRHDETSDETAPMVPPFSSLGSIHRTREERNPRPEYLKERKSVWLPNTVAAPADGVIGPDWPKQL
jgi:hypothetical protein